MSWTMIDGLLGHTPIDRIDTEVNPANPLGSICKFKHVTYGVGEFIYLQGSASTELGSWMQVRQDDMRALPLAANNKGPVAVSMASTLQGQYGWFQISGKAIGKAASGFVDNGDVYATSTGGVVDDAVVSGDRVKNARGASNVGAAGTGLAEFEIHRPFMDDGVAA